MPADAVSVLLVVVLDQPDCRLEYRLTERDVPRCPRRRCLADAYPYPTYEWYEEVYEDDQLKYNKVDPLKDSRFTISGGVLMIFAPDQASLRDPTYF